MPSAQAALPPVSPGRPSSAQAASDSPHCSSAYRTISQAPAASLAASRRRKLTGTARMFFSVPQLRSRSIIWPTTSAAVNGSSSSIVLAITLPANSGKV